MQGDEDASHFRSGHMRAFQDRDAAATQAADLAALQRIAGGANKVRARVRV